MRVECIAESERRTHEVVIKLRFHERLARNPSFSDVNRISGKAANISAMSNCLCVTGDLRGDNSIFTDVHFAAINSATFLKVVQLPLATLSSPVEP
jgi:hypothetical protein